MCDSLLQQLQGLGMTRGEEEEETLINSATGFELIPLQYLSGREKKIRILCVLIFVARLCCLTRASFHWLAAQSAWFFLDHTIVH